jgi:enoyl-CoA hydratase
VKLDASRKEGPMNFDDYKAMTFRRDGKVLHAIFNRPDTLNAMDGVMQPDADRLFDDVAADPQTHVLVLSGAGRAFSAGGDIEALRSYLDRPEALHEEAMKGKQRCFAQLDCPKPIIAKVHGAAMGVGCTLALFSDVVFATKSARFADPHVLVGLSAGDGGAVIWPALMGYGRARPFLLSGDAVTGEEAERLGLIYRAVEPAELDATVDAFAQRLANGAAKAIQYTKLSINIGLRRLCEAVLDESFEMELKAQQSRDHREAIHAFLEKRAPQFTGE